MNLDKDLYIHIGSQLKKAREKKNISLDTLVELIGGIKTKSSLKRYEDGESRIEMDILETICNNLDLDYLDVISNARSNLAEYDFEKVVEMTNNSIIFDDYFPLHYSTNLSAGTLEELLDSEPDAIVYVPIKYQSKKKRLHAFKVNGTSMDNVIPDGSIVVAEDIAEVSTKIKDGTIIVAWIDGQATVKRIYIKENQITLMPDSHDKNHMPIVINTEIQTVKIIGRVIWHMNPDDIEKNY